MAGGYYPVALMQMCIDMRAQNIDPALIALKVRETFPKFPRFTAKAAVRVGLRYKKELVEETIQRAKRPPPVTTCQYITFASYPDKCGAPGYPYCEHHKRVTSNASAGSSFHHLKTYSGAFP